jgi:hypothetical protein
MCVRLIKIIGIDTRILFVIGALFKMGTQEPQMKRVKTVMRMTGGCILKKKKKMLGLRIQKVKLKKTTPEVKQG